MGFIRLVSVVRAPILFLVAAVCIGAARPVFADSKPLGLELSLASDTISLGEPVVVKFRVTNPNQHTSAFYLGARGRGWLDIKLVDTARQQSVARLEPSVHGQTSRQLVAGEHIGDYVPAQGSYEGLLVVSRWLTIPRAGAYTIAIRARLPYAVPKRPGTFATVSEAKSSRTTVETQAALPLVVSKADPQRLQAVAALLRKAAFGPDTGRLRHWAIEQLFAMPGREAVSSWRMLANDPRLDADGERAVLQQLEELGSRQAVDFLAWLTWSSRQPARWTGARHQLVRMYRSSSTDAGIKRRIEELFQRNEGSRASDSPVIDYDS